MKDHIYQRVKTLITRNMTPDDVKEFLRHMERDSEDHFFEMLQAWIDGLDLTRR